MLTIDDIAAICHEATRRYCIAIGDGSQKAWSDASWWQHQSAIAGVLFVKQNPDAPPSAAHENWLSHKQAEGWVYGEVKDEEKRTHPCILAYAQLPEEQRTKDTLFRSIVLALTQGEQHV